jgi:hypothetical protein
MTNFSIFASQRSELTLWVELGFSPNLGLENVLVEGLQEAPGLGHFSSSKFFRQNNICISPYWVGVMTEAAESLSIEWHQITYHKISYDNPFKKGKV